MENTEIPTRYEGEEERTAGASKSARQRTEEAESQGRAGSPAFRAAKHPPGPANVPGGPVADAILARPVVKSGSQAYRASPKVEAEAHAQAVQAATAADDPSS